MLLARFNAPINAVRRLLSILLLAIVSLPLISPLLALGATGERSLPACCRRNGKHHCTMVAARYGDPSQSKHTLITPPEKCPYAPGTLAATHPDAFGAPPGSALVAAVVRNTGSVPQTLPNRRTWRDRSRQKRGPPSLLG